MSKLASILTTDDLPLSELHALRLDGELFAIDEAFAPVDQPDSVSQRAKALEHLCSGRLIAEQRTAAWVWGACDTAPTQLDLCASIGARARVSDSGRIALREVVIDDSEVATIGGLRVTTPLRTVIDLLRFQPRFEGELIQRLLVAGGLSAEDCHSYLEARNNLPRKKLAAARLGDLAVRQSASNAIDVVHSVDTPHGAQHPVEVGRVAHLEYIAAEG